MTKISGPDKTKTALYLAKLECSFVPYTRYRKCLIVFKTKADYSIVSDDCRIVAFFSGCARHVSNSAPSFCELTRDDETSKLEQNAGLPHQDDWQTSATVKTRSDIKVACG